MFRLNKPKMDLEIKIDKSSNLQNSDYKIGAQFNGTFSERFGQCVYPAVLIITRTDYVLKKIFPRQLVFACFDQWSDKN